MIRGDDDRIHAKLSPSASGRWMNCAGSVEVNSRGGRASKYAEEGTAAHALLEICYRGGVDPERFLGKCLYKDYETTQEMCDAVSLALDWVKSYCARNKKAKVRVEMKVDPAALAKVQKDLTSGTLDISVDNAPEELIVIDYKHGAGIVVEAVDNTQLLQYLVGYVAQHATGKYKRYTTVIIQPRARHEDGPVREEHYTHAEVVAYANRIGARVKEIFKDPTQREAGKWCAFCAGAGKCRTLAEYSLQTAQLEFGSVEDPKDPKTLTPKQLAWAMGRMPAFEKWQKAVYAAVYEIMMKGGEVKGQKLVYGRTTRSWSDEERAKELLLTSFVLNEVAPRKLLTVAQTTVLLKRRLAETVDNRKKRAERFGKAWKRFEKLIRYSEKNIHVAPESDPRERVKRGEEFDHVKEKR